MQTSEYGDLPFKTSNVAHAVALRDV